MSFDYNLAVCGAGPAGMGFLFHAYKKGFLKEFINNGLIIIDNKTTLGGGDLGKYNMTANTTAGTFLESITEIDPDSIFDNIKANSAIYSQLESKTNEPVSLNLISLFLEEISMVLLSYIKKNGGKILNKSNLLSAKQLDDGYQLHIENKEGKETIFNTKKIIMNLGATQNKSTSINILKNSDYLADYDLDESKILTTNDIITEPLDQIDFQENMSIIGASHSAFSAIEIISKSNKCKTLNLIYYSPIRIQYPSISAAKEDNYTFDQELDVCSITGGVNRYGGLRFTARDIALSILKTNKIYNNEIDINLIEIKQENHAIIQNYLTKTDKIITCFGYEPNLPIFLNKDDSVFSLKLRGLGVFVDSNGGIYKENGKALNNMYAFGIGAGLSRSKEIGGELSFQGRVDGVWLYHNDIGKRVLNDVL